MEVVKLQAGFFSKIQQTKVFENSPQTEYARKD